jgi:hypothetical protein
MLESEFVGSFSEGQMFHVDSHSEIPEFVSANILSGVPLSRVLIVRAWEELFDGNFRGAIVDAATVMEDCITRIMIKRLPEIGLTDDKTGRRYVREASKRTLVRTMFRRLNIESEQWRKEVVRSINVRHKLVHSFKRYGTYGEAEMAVKHADRILEIAQECQCFDDHLPPTGRSQPQTE